MVERERLNNGTFAPKSPQTREVRSLRLTDNTWGVLGKVAGSRDITRADLIEEIVTSGAIEQWVSGLNEVGSLEEKPLESVEKESLTRQLSTLQDGLGLNEIQGLRDKVLSSLGIGEQSNIYRNAKKAFNKFIKTHFSA